MLDQNTILQLGKHIVLSKKVLLINHINMDPDAFGSLAAFYHILSAAGYNIKAVNDIMPPESFSFLNSSHIFETDLDIGAYAPDLIISFDASSIAQLGSQYSHYPDSFEQAEFYVIDHHVSNPGFGQYNIIDSGCSSTCEITLHIIETIGLTKYMTPDIATLLTAGLHTDTNIYYNQNTSAETLRTGAKLMEYGADFRLTMFEFFKKKTFNKTKLWGQLLSNIVQDGAIYYGIITQDMFDMTDTNSQDSSGIINEFLANMEGMQVCFLIYPLPNGETKVSMRSAAVDVSQIASMHGGGGHVLAAGFQTDMTPEQTAEQLLQQLKKEL